MTLALISSSARAFEISIRLCRAIERRAIRLRFCIVVRRFMVHFLH